MMSHNGHEVEIPASESLRCPYHAKVMKMLLTMSKQIVKSAVFINVIPKKTTAKLLKKHVSELQAEQ